MKSQTQNFLQKESPQRKKFPNQQQQQNAVSNASKDWYIENFFQLQSQMTYSPNTTNAFIPHVSIQCEDEKFVHVPLDIAKVFLQRLEVFLEHIDLAKERNNELQLIFWPGEELDKFRNESLRIRSELKTMSDEFMSNSDISEKEISYIKSSQANEDPFISPINPFEPVPKGLCNFFKIVISDEASDYAVIAPWQIIKSPLIKNQRYLRDQILFYKKVKLLTVKERKEKLVSYLSSLPDSISVAVSDEPLDFSDYVIRLNGLPSVGACKILEYCNYMWSSKGLTSNDRRLWMINFMKSLSKAALCATASAAYQLGVTDILELTCSSIAKHLQLASADEFQVLIKKQAKGNGQNPPDIPPLPDSHGLEANVTFEMTTTTNENEIWSEFQIVNKLRKVLKAKSIKKDQIASVNEELFWNVKKSQQNRNEKPPVFVEDTRDVDDLVRFIEGTDEIEKEKKGKDKKGKNSDSTRNTTPSLDGQRNEKDVNWAHILNDPPCEEVFFHSENLWKKLNENSAIFGEYLKKFQKG